VIESRRPLSPEEIIAAMRHIAAEVGRSNGRQYEQINYLLTEMEAQEWHLQKIRNIVSRIADLRRSSLHRARTPDQTVDERAYFMAEANAYNVVLDLLAEEFGSDTVWMLAK